MIGDGVRIGNVHELGRPGRVGDAPTSEGNNNLRWLCRESDRLIVAMKRVMTVERRGLTGGHAW